MFLFLCCVLGVFVGAVFDTTLTGVALILMVPLVAGILHSYFNNNAKGQDK